MLVGLTRLNDKTYNEFVEAIQIPHEGNTCTYFLKIVHYVRGLQIGENGWNEDHLRKIVRDIYGEDSQKHLENLERKLSRYKKPTTPSFEAAEREPNRINSKWNAFVRFCNENLYFAYGLIEEDVSTNQALSYIDLRKKESTTFIDLAVTILLKQCGILLKDREARPKSRSIKIKRRIDAEAICIENNVIYPTSKLKYLAIINKTLLFYTFSKI